MPATHTFEELLLELSLCDFNLDSLVNLLGVSSLVVRIVLDGGGELLIYQPPDVPKTPGQRDFDDDNGFRTGLLTNVLIKVVLPKPDSPATMIVKAAPRFATILWRWLGRLRMLAVRRGCTQAPTHFAMPIGDALSVAGGAIVCNMIVTLGYCEERRVRLWRRSVDCGVVLRRFGNQLPLKMGRFPILAATNAASGVRTKVSPETRKK